MAEVFHNSWASCEPDPRANQPIHAVTAWTGNTPKIALGLSLRTPFTAFPKVVKGGC